MGDDPAPPSTTLPSAASYGRRRRRWQSTAQLSPSSSLSSLFPRSPLLASNLAAPPLPSGLETTLPSLDLGSPGRICRHPHLVLALRWISLCGGVPPPLFGGWGAMVTPPPTPGARLLAAGVAGGPMAVATTAAQGVVPPLPLSGGRGCGHAAAPWVAGQRPMATSPSSITLRRTLATSSRAHHTCGCRMSASHPRLGGCFCTLLATPSSGSMGGVPAGGLSCEVAMYIGLHLWEGMGWRRKPKVCLWDNDGNAPGTLYLF